MTCSDRVAAERLASVDLDQVAVDVGRLIRGEEDSQVGDIVDLAPPLEWDGLGEDLVEVLVVEQLPGQRGLGVGRADAVDADAERK